MQGISFFRYRQAITNQHKTRDLLYELCGSAPLREIIARKDAESQSMGYR